MNSPEKFVRFFVASAGCAGALLLAGCSSTWQYVKLPDQSQKVTDSAKGRVYVVRLSDTNAVAPVVVADGMQLIGSTRPHGYLCWERAPGNVTVISSSKGESQLNFKLTAGEVCFIFQRVGPGRLSAESTMEIVSYEEGQAALKDCKPPRLHSLAQPVGQSRAEPITTTTGATVITPGASSSGGSSAGGVSFGFPTR